MRSRRPSDPPAGLSNHVSRREAARLLGFASEFPIRRLEKDGRLHAVRGAMGQAWYPREAVLALRAPADRAEPLVREITTAGPAPPEAAGAQPPGVWSDAQLIGLLREPVPARQAMGAFAGEAARPRTVVDLVADTGITIARAVRIHRFWLAHDQHPTAVQARAEAARPPRPSTPAPPSTLPVVAGAPVIPAAQAAPGDSARPGRRSPTDERRGPDRVEREDLIRRLRDPDPAVRAFAFEKLRPRRKS